MAVSVPKLMISQPQRRLTLLLVTVRSSQLAASRRERILRWNPFNLKAPSLVLDGLRRLLAHLWYHPPPSHHPCPQTNDMIQHPSLSGFGAALLYTACSYHIHRLAV